MKHKWIIAADLTLCLVTAMLLTAAANSAEPIERQARLTPTELTCEYAVNPLGVDAARPRFGWVLKSNERGQMQSAYQILVAGSQEKLLAGVGDKWDSGKVESNRSVNVAYRGKALASGEKCYWRVRVWDKQGQPSTWSEPWSFGRGVLKQCDSQAHWNRLRPGSFGCCRHFA